MINIDPDVRFFIRSNLESQKLTFQLLVRDPSLGPMLVEYGPLSLRRDTDELQSDLKRELGELRKLLNQGKLKADTVDRRLASIGTTLFRQLPEDLQERFCSLLGRATTVQIISDEPKIPWELMKLQTRQPGMDNGPFLCEAFAVTRWLPRMTGSVRLVIRSIAIIVPSDSHLPESKLEREDMLSLATPRRTVLEIEPIYLAVTEALRLGDHDAWHFCGHGTANAIDPNRMTFQLLHNEQPLRPEDVNAHRECLSRRQPLVFLNACETGESGFSWTNLGGWAHEFLEAGAGAFLGTLWPVGDKEARAFAKEFYRRFLGNEPIAEALRQTRLHVRNLFPGDPSWLAYIAYAHPSAKAQEELPDSTLVTKKGTKSGRIAPPPDLEIHTHTILKSGSIHIEYHLRSPSGTLEFKDLELVGSVILGPPEEYQAQLLRLTRKIELLNQGLDTNGELLLMKEIKGKLDGIGRNLYREFFPPELRQAYRSFRKEHLSVMFFTDEPRIPWELIKPYDDSDMDEIIDDDFLCLRFPMTRWLLSADRPAAEEIRVRRFAFLGGEAFPRSKTEKERIKEFASKHSGIEDVSPSEPTVAALEYLLDTESAELLHFAGRFTDRTFQPEDLHGPRATKIRRNQPLVFFNFNDELSGWESRWVKDCGCGAFVGPLWSIKDSLAYEFAAIFYDALSRGETFGRAVQEGRQRLHALQPSIPTWLAYTFYGHVNGRLGPSEL
jgi:CHAT domain